MRDLKFRAWDTHNNKMRELKFRIWDGNNKHFVYPDILELDRGLEYQQFTGLLDKQGKKIYEGDIVKDKLGNTASVEFDPESGGWRLCLTTLPSGKKILNWGFENCEVIGNVWENPELLKEIKCSTL